MPNRKISFKFGRLVTNYRRISNFLKDGGGERLLFDFLSDQLLENIRTDLVAGDLYNYYLWHLAANLRLIFRNFLLFSLLI